MSTSRTESSGLPDWLEDRVLEILDRHETDYVWQLLELCREHPEHEAEIRAMLQAGNRSGASPEEPEETASPPVLEEVDEEAGNEQQREEPAEQQHEQQQQERPVTEPPREDEAPQRVATIPVRPLPEPPPLDTPPVVRPRPELRARYPGALVAGLVVVMALWLSVVLWQASLVRASERKARQTRSLLEESEKRARTLAEEAVRQRLRVAASQIVVRENLTPAGDHERKTEQYLKEAERKLRLAEVSEREARRDLELAKQKEQEAKKNLQLARSGELRLMADLGLLLELERTADRSLWPPTEASVRRMRAWISRAEDLRGRLELYRDRLTALAPDRDGSWHRDVVARLVRRLKAMGEPKSGRLAEMRSRLAVVLDLRRRSLEEPLARRAWREAIAAIRSSDDQRASRLYRKLEIEPQCGLLPVGMDPDSKLWEFAHLPSGAAPVRHTESGKLLLDERTGIVLVLIPGGSFWMGAQRSDPNWWNHDSRALDNESDGAWRPRRMDLAPFFLSKYELTQGQWQRIAGRNPSAFSRDERSWPTSSGPRAVTALHPVESVSWFDCEEMLHRQDLVLPTEAQWEYATRAGTETPWWSGRNKRELAGSANLADAFFLATGGASRQADGDLDDGFFLHAPVGTLRPNAFGLHDVAGNVREWCLDGYGSYDLKARPGTGLREHPGACERVLRGGSWRQGAACARSAFRLGRPPETRQDDLGCRPARVLR